jgi:hypothetical protein
MNTVTSLTPPVPAELTLPDLRPLSAVGHGELYGEFDRLKIRGFVHQLGRTDAIAKYASHLQAIHDEAGRAAVAAWLAANK